MSHLSIELERQLAASGKSVDQVAQITGISRGQIYLWKRGEQTRINEAQITALSLALSDDPAEHVGLLMAHLEDETFGPAAQFVSVQYDPATKWRPQPSELDVAFYLLQYLAVHDSEIRTLFLNLANILECKAPPKTRERLSRP